MMSLLGYKVYVEYEDTVILFLGHDTMVPIVVKQGTTTQTKYGALRHNDIIGKEYGSKVSTVNSRGWVHILHPTPELWTVNLPHRTQILYFADISMITMQLELKPGALMAEAGTGSGSMSHSAARTLAPNGHLYTFEFHEQRAETARSEFKQHGLGDIITVTHRDVCENGFGLDIKVDAVFLDLPSPDRALAHAKKILKCDGGRICTFSPCIEQVQRTCIELENQGFGDVTTMECLLRNYDTRTVSFPVPNMGIVESNDANVEVDQCLPQNGNSKNTAIPKIPSKDNEGVVANNQVGTPDEPDGKNGDSNKAAEGTKTIPDGKNGDSNKTAEDTKTIPDGSTLASGPSVDVSQRADGAKRFKKDVNDRPGWRGKAKASSGQHAVKCAVPSKEQPGHTGYLTFATLFVTAEG